MAAAQSPYFTQDGPDREDSGNQYIANMRDGAVAGFKYFAFKDAAEIKVHCTGSANGRLQVSTAPDFSTLDFNCCSCAVAPLRIPSYFLR